MSAAGRSHLSRLRVRSVCRIVLAETFLLSLILSCLGRGARAQQTTSPQSSGERAAQFLVPLSLSKSLDSKKASVGEEVEAKVAVTINLAGGMAIPRGAKAIGRVAVAKARSRGDSESSLQILFDKINLGGGKVLAIAGTLQAVGPNLPSEESEGTGGWSRLDEMGGHFPPGDAAQPVPILNQQSVGAYGIKNVRLTPEGVLISDGKDVKLDQGSQMLVRARFTAGS
jgi:hypothetical protein